MLFFTKNFEKSLNQYKKANLIIQNKIDILLGMGSTYFITGKTKEALQTLEKVLGIEPNNIKASSRIERIKLSNLNHERREQ
jgi:cytochrome c-type biogenesis protein CcmH/NrfG